MRLTKRLMATVAIVALGLLVLTACGGGGSETSSNGGGASSGSGNVIEIELGPGFVFNPSEITVTQGQEVTLKLKNVDSIAHNIEIPDFNVNQDVAAGEEVEVKFTPDKAGEFEFICNIPGHVEGGMVGTLIVQ
ncbi:MAG TPA: cupredoxin domain-containing protein [Bacillota bacterium]|mgnify:CR=1 FL=1